MKNLFFRKLFLCAALWFVAVVAVAYSDAGTVSFSAIGHLHATSLSLWVVDILMLLIAPLVIVYSEFVIGRRMKAVNDVAIEAEHNVENNLGFTTKLIEGDLQYEFSPQDMLGQSLVKLRDRLKENALDEQRRKKEDEQRSWDTEGQAKFAEILRENNNKDLETLTYAVVKNIVKYLGANQGGVFLYEEDFDRFVMSACYAYGKKKIREKIIESGEGLIGRIGVERDTIYLTDIPEKYINISSGLGEERPRCLLLVPIIANETLYGAIEIASFQNIEKYQIRFLEKIAEILGSTISGVRINLQTAALLQDSQEQSKKMVRQEEEMRKNMEEMKVLQKEAAKQAEEFVSFSNSVNHTMIRADYDVEGTLIYANTKFISKMGYEFSSDVDGKSIFTFINEKDREWFNKIWESLSLGGKHYEGFMKHMTKDGEDLWTLSTYTCVRDENGDVRKILFLAIDTTENKKKSLDFEGIIKALDRSSMKMEVTLEGKIANPNTNVIYTFGYSLEELSNKTIEEIVDGSDHEKFKTVWDTALAHNACEETLAFTTNTGAKRWLFGSFTSVRDMYGDVGKIIFVGNDVTEQVLIEQKVGEQNKKLREQELELQNQQVKLEKELEQAKADMKLQFSEIEKVKVLNEKTLEGAIDAIFTIDAHGEVTFFNQAAEQLFELSKGDIIGKNVTQLFSEETIGADSFVANLVDQNKAKVVGVRQEVNIKTKSGEELPVLMLISEAEYEGSITYTAFVQKIEVELF